MAVSKSAVQVQWGGSNSVNVTAGNAQTSDVVALDATSFNAMVQLKATTGSPASGDKIDFYINYSTGDPDANPDTADEYDSQTQGTWLAQLDCQANNPALTTVPINPSAKSYKLYAKSSAATNTITVSAQMYESKA